MVREQYFITADHSVGLHSIPSKKGKLLLEVEKGAHGDVEETSHKGKYTFIKITVNGTTGFLQTTEKGHTLVQITEVEDDDEFASPPPDFDESAMPPPDFDESAMPPPDFDDSLPPPEDDFDELPPPDSDDDEMPPPDDDFVETAPRTPAVSFGDVEATQTASDGQNGGAQRRSRMMSSSSMAVLERREAEASDGQTGGSGIAQASRRSREVLQRRESKPIDAQAAWNPAEGLPDSSGPAAFEDDASKPAVFEDENSDESPPGYDPDEEDPDGLPPPDEDGFDGDGFEGELPPDDDDGFGGVLPPDSDNDDLENLDDQVREMDGGNLEVTFHKSASVGIGVSAGLDPAT